MTIRLDYNNMMREFIGDEGITTENPPTQRSENSKAKKAKAGSAGWIYPFIREKLWRT